MCIDCQKILGHFVKQKTTFLLAKVCFIVFTRKNPSNLGIATVASSILWIFDNETCYKYTLQFVKAQNQLGLA